MDYLNREDFSDISESPKIDSINFIQKPRYAKKSNILTKQFKLKQ